MDIEMVLEAAQYAVARELLWNTAAPPLETDGRGTKIAPNMFKSRAVQKRWGPSFG